MLLVGMEQARTKSGTFHDDLAELVSDFEGPIAIMVQGTNEGSKTVADVLVPVNGTDVRHAGLSLQWRSRRPAAGR